MKFGLVLGALLVLPGVWAGVIPDAASFSAPYEGTLGQGKDPSALPGRVDYYCSLCHPVPNPQSLPRSLWPANLAAMHAIMVRQKIHVPLGTLEKWLAYYTENSPEALPELPYFHADPEGYWKPSPFGDAGPMAPVRAPEDVKNNPVICHLNVVDLDQDGRSDVLVCDGTANQVRWLHPEGAGWTEQVLADIPVPVHTEVFDYEGDGRLDIAVAALGKLAKPDDSKVGAAYLLSNNGNQRFKANPLISRTYRVADIQPVDMDGDRDLDFLLGIYGWRYAGDIAWLEQRGGGQFELHPLVSLNGCSHILPMELNGDGRMDFVALFSQQHEMIIAYTNEGRGRFTEQTLFQARNPSFGSTLIKKADLDRDGDEDILYINGDGLDATGPKPYHGIQWLENRGQGRFAVHDLIRYYGVYGIAAGDLDGDGDLDLAASSQFNLWSDPKRFSLIWLENDGLQNFTPHGIAHAPTHLGTVALLDVDADGKLDILAGGMHFIPPFDRMGRLTVWHNNLPRKE